MRWERERNRVNIAREEGKKRRKRGWERNTDPNHPLGDRCSAPAALPIKIQSRALASIPISPRNYFHYIQHEYELLRHSTLTCNYYLDVSLWSLSLSHSSVLSFTPHQWLLRSRRLRRYVRRAEEVPPASQDASTDFDLIFTGCYLSRDSQDERLSRQAPQLRRRRQGERACRHDRR